MKPKAPTMQTAAPPDPQLEALKAQADEDRIAAMQQTAGQKTSDLLLRYGARAAFAGSNVTPLVPVG